MKCISGFSQVNTKSENCHHEKDKVDSDTNESADFKQGYVRTDEAEKALQELQEVMKRRPERLQRKNKVSIPTKPMAEEASSINSLAKMKDIASDFVEKPKYTFTKGSPDSNSQYMIDETCSTDINQGYVRTDEAEKALQELQEVMERRPERLNGKNIRIKY